MQQEQVFCHDGEKWFLVAPAVRNTVELSLYKKGLKIAHPHHVMLDRVEPALHPDVAHKDSHAAVFPERHIELPDTEVQLFQKVIVIFAPRQVIRVRLSPHIPGILDDVMVGRMEKDQIRRVLHVIFQGVPSAFARRWGRV